ncbi:Antibiotic biosynthesis monooxygenase [Pseudomonas cichorii]|uniref:Antibiotic biosynthesis monooxygenase n=1 Tax=Pseudomonas cichorii TaxID=36746 RepID=A0A3M4M1V3_PSECI|nr:putative quinol monooxygenase [Pseudomonas cichorii]RMQ47697.1 Antibiotic biosynthesis monooxygenase [Pseudomonas cichorii]
MKLRHLFSTCTTTLCLLASSLVAAQQFPPSVVVRVAQLEIDPQQLERYSQIVKEEMEISARDEPGVIAIYSVAEKDQPNKLHFFEIYASEQAYLSHIASAHFKRYVEETRSMIRSRKLIETTPVQLSSK